ncbi:MAG: hypothetical protein M3O28_13550 [Actinomycetota bacterium]|nr:hypothetical protein [Actinomycetota bacterium]
MPTPKVAPSLNFSWMWTGDAFGLGEVIVDGVGAGAEEDVAVEREPWPVTFRSLCGGRIHLAALQHAIATDWSAAVRSLGLPAIPPGCTG